MSIETLSRSARKGSVYLMTLVLLCILAVVALAVSGTADLGLQKSVNYRCASKAQIAAESGVAFMMEVIRPVRLPPDTTNETMMADLYERLVSDAKITGNIAEPVLFTEDYIYVPDIQSPAGSFCAWFAPAGQRRCSLTIRGLSDGSVRRVRVEMDLTQTRAAVFDYGLASRGKIYIGGSSTVVGVNHPWEASVCSTSELHNDAIHVDGSATVSGDLYAAGEDNYVVVTGSPSIAGSRNPADWADHIHIGSEVPDFPEVDITTLIPLANGDVITKQSDISNRGTYNNVVIEPGVNPTFNNKVTINGIVYVKSPNVVRFEGGADLNGFIIAEDKGDALENCQLHFAGHVEARGVEVLPDTPEFAAVKQSEGTFIAATGFGVTFTGTFSTINGSVAGAQLTFTGNAEGNIRGSVIGMRDLPTVVTGNVDIFVDRINSSASPAGFVRYWQLNPQPSSYTELVGSGG